MVDRMENLAPSDGGYPIVQGKKKGNVDNVVVSGGNAIGLLVSKAVTIGISYWSVKR